jgi:asparagine synthase (glutamine-hydrolysing)
VLLGGDAACLSNGYKAGADVRYAEAPGRREILDRLAAGRKPFALALYDESSGGLVLARDRIGIRPLYYYAPPEALCFASEIKALLAIPTVP